ncbi:MAG: Stk1 family PASTA domain-containing Ser/Thr kinase [Bilifractor sp.]|jgi:serine/threonine protein kinase/transcription elongation GreA/GreB family factor
MLREGIVLGERYEIISRIGSGGMADVYKARDHKLSRLVAVKVMKAEFREDTSFVSKFQKEAQAAARLSHPNVVNVFDVGEDRGLYYIVMELVEGITLKNYINKKGKLSVKEATSIAIQVSLGLQAAHNQGIIHRDVKPQNIIISTDGKVKLSDFGIAKATNSNTITANVMGSVHYSSPEQVRGGISDARSDIYSLGITMYEMVTGRVPFDGDTTVSIAIKHLQEEIVPPSRYTPDLPHALEQIILKCTQKNQIRRYQNVGDLIEDLKRSLLDPQGDFVVIGPVNDQGQTVRVSDAEMQEIRNGVSGKNKKQQEKIRKYDDYAEEENEDAHKGSKLEKGLTIGGFIIGAIIIIILIFVIGNMFGIFNTNTNDSGSTAGTSSVSSSSEDQGTVEVPDFTGMTVDEATEEANKLKIGIKRKGTESSSTYPEGQIISQDPEAGKTVEESTTVYVIVSTGVETVNVPSGLVGSSQSDAEKALTDVGLVASVELQEDEDVDAGTVISTSPEEGTSVNAGSTVTLYVSKGSSDITVPDLRGYDEATAKSALENLGLNTTSTTGSSDNYGEGEVISMDPEPGTEVSAGTTVTLTINSSESDHSDGESTGSGSYICYRSLAEPEGYNGGTVKLELVQGDLTTVIYEGSNPWVNGDYDEPIVSTSGETGVINVYEDGVRKWQYTDVEFEEQ